MLHTLSANKRPKVSQTGNKSRTEAFQQITLRKMVLNKAFSNFKTGSKLRYGSDYKPKKTYLMMILLGI